MHVQLQLDEISHSPKNPWADPEGAGRTGGPEPLKNYKNIGFPSNIEPDLLKITNLPSHNSMEGGGGGGGALSARQRNAISTAFRWRADDGKPLVAFGSSLHPLN